MDTDIEDHFHLQHIGLYNLSAVTITSSAVLYASIFNVSIKGPRI